MEISSEKTGRTLVVRVAGELDLDTAREFRARIDADLDRFASRDLILDFGLVSFVDSSGLGAILGRYRRVTEKGGTVVLCRPVDHVRRLLDQAGVSRVIRIHQSREQAIRALGQKDAALGGDTR